MALLLAACGGGDVPEDPRRVPFAATTTAVPAYDRDDLYRFFAIAFGAAPGVTYMGQLVEAAEVGRMSIKEIVNVFTTKSQFLETYPATLTNQEYAQKLVDNVVGTSANAAAKSEAVADIVEALKLPNWTRGDITYAIFNNLAKKPADDAKWAGTAKKMANQVAYAKHYTETMKVDTTDLIQLRAVVKSVTESSPINGAEVGALIQIAIQAATGSGGGGSPVAGAVASFVETEVPGSSDTNGAIEFAATNSGLYMRLAWSDLTHTRVMKLHGSPTFSDWSTATIQGVIGSWTPSNVYSEGKRGVSFYWSAFTPEGQRWGHYTANTGGVSIDIVDDLGIAAVAAGGREGIFTPQPWVWDFNGSIRHEDSMYTALNTTSDRFSVAVPGPSALSGRRPAMLSHPFDPLLFVGFGDTLAVYSSTGLLSTLTMPPASGAVSFLQPFSDFTWYDGQLWFAYGDKVYRRMSTGEVTHVADAPNPSPTGRFCIQGGKILMADGTAVRISDGRKHSWVSEGDLTPEQSSKASEIQGKMIAVYCSPTSQGVYAPTPWKIRMIFPI